jgi:SSS family solute:Na+ symporter
MTLNSLDVAVATSCLAVSFLPAVFFARRSGRGTSEFFASGRSAPWWLIGTSMVATTFSTDTPNLVTDLVRSQGVFQNWVWWSFLLTGMLTVFFYARLWRRSGVLTDLELYELRYSGRSAALVRGFRALYLGLLFNAVMMAAVTLAAAKIASVLLGWTRLETVIVCSLVAVPFAATAGLWGVLATDLVQFAIAMLGVVAAAFFALRHPSVGGLEGLVAQTPAEALSVLPDFSRTDLLLAAFVIPLTVQWWAVWYPGAEPGGGSYIAQRMLAARDERHALAGTLWFNVAHYALRPWPWIVVALASRIVFPTLDDLRRALPHVSPDLIGNDLAYPAMLTLLPHGWLGLLLAALAAAYVSTISTHLNWGSSYLVMDFYKRFVRPEADEPHLVRVSRATSVLLMLLASGLTFLLTTAGETFTLVLSVGAGTGLIYLLRWFWWRINAWSEIAAMASSFAIAMSLFLARRAGYALPDHTSLLVTTAGTTLCWLAVTWLTPPVDHDRLVTFFRRVRPAGPGWAPIRARVVVEGDSGELALALGGWLLGCAFVYAALFGVGAVLTGQPLVASTCAVLFLAAGLGLWRVLRRLLSTAPA